MVRSVRFHSTRRIFPGGAYSRCMSPRRFLGLVATAATAWTFLLAQTPSEPTPPGALPDTPAPPPVQDPGPRLDFAFDNTPLLAVISAVQERYQNAVDRPLNVVVPNSLSDLVRTNLITLKVSQVTVNELFQMLSQTSEMTVPYIANWVTTPGSVKSVPLFRSGKGNFTFEPLRGSDSSAPPTFLLVGRFPADAPQPDGPLVFRGDPVETEARLVQFYSLEPVLDRYSVEDVTTAIKTGWELSGAKTQPTMKFHEETKLLVVAGDQYQHQMVNQVLSSLKAPSPPRVQQRPSAVPVNPTPTPQ